MTSPPVFLAFRSPLMCTSDVTERSRHAIAHRRGRIKHDLLRSPKFSVCRQLVHLFRLGELSLFSCCFKRLTKCVAFVTDHLMFELST